MALKLDPIENRRRLRLYESGLADSVIAKKVGVDSSTIAYWRLKNGLPANKKAPMRVTEKEIKKMKDMRDKGMSYEKIGLELGRSASVIINHLSGKTFKKCEIKCVDCKKPFIIHRKNMKRCKACRETQEEKFHEIRITRYLFYELADNNIEEAERIAEQIEKEEGKEFAELCLDGILENVKKKKGLK